MGKKTQGQTGSDREKVALQETCQQRRYCEQQTSGKGMSESSMPAPAA